MTAKSPGGRDSEGIGSDSWLSLRLQPVRSIVCPVRFSNSSHSKAASVPCCGGSYWISFITTSPSFDGVAVGDGVGVGVSVGVGVVVRVGEGGGVRVRVGVGIGVGMGVGGGVRVKVGVGLGVGDGEGVRVNVCVGVCVSVGVVVDVGDGVGISVADGKLQPGEGVELSTKSLAWFVSSPGGWRSNEWPSGTSWQGGDIMALSSS